MRIGSSMPAGIGPLCSKLSRLVRTPLSPLLLLLSNGGFLVLCIVAQENSQHKCFGKLGIRARPLPTPRESQEKGVEAMRDGRARARGRALFDRGPLC